VINHNSWDSPYEGPELVSSCCGYEYERLNLDGEIHYKCYNCYDEFEKPELDSEYQQNMLESYIENCADEERLER
tara:strand:- start:202 stop:426 length:225 start_codon:yes stop_codon:yes gene_type:complete